MSQGGRASAIEVAFRELYSLERQQLRVRAECGFWKFISCWCNKAGVNDVARSCDSGKSVVRRVGRSIRSDCESGEESTRGEYREVNSGSGSNGRGRELW